MSKISIEDLKYCYINENGRVYKKVADAMKNKETIVSCITVDKQVENVTLEDYITMFNEIDGLDDNAVLEVVDRPTDTPFTITGKQLKICLTLLYHTWLVAEDYISTPNDIHLELGINNIKEILESTKSSSEQTSYFS